jgi:hypothetical protein
MEGIAGFKIKSFTRKIKPVVASSLKKADQLGYNKKSEKTSSGRPRGTTMRAGAFLKR